LIKKRKSINLKFSLCQISRSDNITLFPRNSLLSCYLDNVLSENHRSLQMENLKEVKLNDFYQAVILKTIGFPLIRLEKTADRFVTFVFGDSKNQAEEVIKRYWDRELSVKARDLIETINELKTRLHSGV